MYKDKYSERATKAREAEAERFREEGRQQERLKVSAQPYPVRGGADTSPLAALDAEKGTNAQVDAAVRAYEELTAARG